MDKNVNYPIKQSVNNHCSDNKSRSIWKMWVSVDRFRQTGQVAQVNLMSEALTNKIPIFSFFPIIYVFFFIRAKHLWNHALRHQIVTLWMGRRYGES